MRVREVNLDDYFRFQINFDESEGGLHVRVPDGVKKVTIKTISGSVRAEQLTLKDLAVKTTSGDVQLERAKVTELIFQSTSGDLKGEQLEALKISGKTVSGDMELNLENGDPVMEMSSTSGDIELGFRSQPSFKVNFTSVSGEIGFDQYFEKHFGWTGGKNSFHLLVGKGILDAKTISGDLTFRKH